MASKLDSIEKAINKINITLAEQHLTLKEHIQRTELLESQMEPMQELMFEFKGAIRFVKFIGVAVAIIEGIHQVMSFFN